MRVNSKCAHQVRPPRGRIQLSAVVEETLGDYSLPLPEARQNVRLRGLFSRGGQPVLPIRTNVCAVISLGILGPVKRSWEEFTDKTRTKVGV